MADGNTIRLITISGITTGTFDGPFTENNIEVIRSDGSVTIQGKGMQSGTLGTCGAGSAPYVTEVRGTVSSLSGRFQMTDQAASTSTPTKIHSVDALTVSATGEGAYTGTYHCT